MLLFSDCCVEIPWIDVGGSVDDYRKTLARLAPVVERADAVVAGHGAPQTSAAAARQFDEDLDYLDALERGDESRQMPRTSSAGAPPARGPVNQSSMFKSLQSVYALVATFRLD